MNANIIAWLNDRRNIFVFLAVIFFINILPSLCFGTQKGYAEPVFSITSDNEPLYEVLSKISKSTGYKIEITKGSKNKSLTIALKKIALEKGLREIMRIAEEPNYVIVMDDRSKKIEIRIFGDSSTGQKKSSDGYAGAVANSPERNKASFEKDLVDVNDVRTETSEKQEIIPEFETKIADSE